MNIEINKPEKHKGQFINFWIFEEVVVPKDCGETDPITKRPTITLPERPVRRLILRKVHVS